MVPQRVEGRRPQDGNRGRQLERVDLVHQRPRDAAVADVRRVGPGGHQQDVYAVPRQAVGQRMRIAELVQLPLDLARLGQHAGLRVAQRFPGPVQHARIVAGDPQVQLAVLFVGGRVEQAAGGPVAGQGQKRLLAPGFQRVPKPLGMIGFRGKGIIEKRFQVPAQLADQVAVRAAHDREPSRGRHAYRPDRLAVRQPNHLKLGGIALVDVAHNQRFHPHAPTRRVDRSRKVPGTAPVSTTPARLSRRL